MLEFFDCDVGVRYSGVGLRPAETPKAACAILDRYAIRQALVYDRGATESGVFDHFDPILAFCKGNPRLHPTIPIAPPATGENPPPDELVDMILEYGIKGVRVWPNLHAFDFDPSSFGRLLERLEKHRIPLFYHSMRITDHPWEHRLDWRRIRETAVAFPKLPIVVTYMGMLEGRRALPVLEGCPNVMTDLTCVSFQYIEYVTEQFGADRLVLASHYPAQDPGLTIPWVSYSCISGKARKRIASGNLERLVEGIR